MELLRALVFSTALIVLGRFFIQAQDIHLNKLKLPEVEVNAKRNTRQSTMYYNGYNHFNPSPWYPFMCPPCNTCECCKCQSDCECSYDWHGQKICPPCLPPRTCPCDSPDVVQRPAPRPWRKPIGYTNKYPYVKCAPCPMYMCVQCVDP